MFSTSATGSAATDSTGRPIAYVSRGLAALLRPRRRTRSRHCASSPATSATAARWPRSAAAGRVDTSMGFTPLEGLVMGSRSGDIDPAILLHVMRKEELGPWEMNALLNKHSGLLGISGISNDMRTLLEAEREGNAARAWPWTSSAIGSRSTSRPTSACSGSRRHRLRGRHRRERSCRPEPRPGGSRGLGLALDHRANDDARGDGSGDLAARRRVRALRDPHQRGDPDRPRHPPLVSGRPPS